MTRSIVACLAVAMIGCPDVSPPEVTLAIVEQSVRADGTTTYLLRSCVTAEDPRQVDAILDATSGSFLFAAEDAPTLVTFRLDGFSGTDGGRPTSCHDEPW